MQYSFLFTNYFFKCHLIEFGDIELNAKWTLAEVKRRRRLRIVQNCESLG